MPKNRAATPRSAPQGRTLARFLPPRLARKPPIRFKFCVFNQALAACRHNRGRTEFQPRTAGLGYRMSAVRRISFSKLSQKDASAAIARHEMLFAGRMGGARAVFAFCDLSGLDLSGRNLSDADFTGALMEETNLQGARLDSASFFGADLRRANLAGATMRRSDMRGASLRGANLIGADLYEADLREGTIAEKDRFGNLRVMQHDVGPSELPDALMSSANLERAKLSG
ncbi:MAG TPA: pentapeptide repeat-containing protein, partial [Sphingomonas sp.]